MSPHKLIDSPCLVQQRSVLGEAWPVWICSNSGVPYGTPECANMMIFGECKPRTDDIPYSKPRARMKYRKTPKTQRTMDGRNLRNAFWGIKELETAKDG